MQRICFLLPLLLCTFFLQGQHFPYPYAVKGNVKTIRYANHDDNADLNTPVWTAKETYRNGRVRKRNTRYRGRVKYGYKFTYTEKDGVLTVYRQGAVDEVKMLVKKIQFSESSPRRIVRYDYFDDFADDAVFSSIKYDEQERIIAYEKKILVKARNLGSNETVQVAYQKDTIIHKGYIDGMKYYETFFVLDDAGNPALTFSQSSHPVSINNCDASLSHRTHYEFDAVGNWIKSTHTDAQGKVISIYTRKIEYEQ